MTAVPTLRRRMRRIEHQLARLVWLKRKWAQVPAHLRLRMQHTDTAIKRLRAKLEQLARRAGDRAHG